MNIALIGSNFIVDEFVKAARQVDGICFHTAYSRTQAQAEENQRKWGTQQASSDWQALLQNTEIEAAYIASPNSLHFVQARDLLQAGKHVLCEKPICLSLAEMDVLLDLAKGRGLVILEAMRPLFLPCLRAIKEGIVTLGKLRFAEFRYCQYSSRYDKYKAGIVENAFRPELGNGALTDIGVYCLAWMEYLFGQPQSLAYYHKDLPQSIDATGLVLADYEDFHAMARFAKVQESERLALLEGEAGYMELLGFPIVRAMRVHRRGEEKRELQFDLYKQDMRYEIEAFLTMCKGEASALEYQQYCRAVVGMLEQLREGRF